MTGCKPVRKSVDAKDARELAIEWDTFYARFAHTDFSAEEEKALDSVKRKADQRILITTEEVSNCFRKTNSRNACGSDQIPGAVLRRATALQLQSSREPFSHPWTPGILPCYGRQPS